MKCDLLIGGVGGQGILSIAFVLDNAALKNGLSFKQSEVHGMAQRGGSVSTHLRLSDQTIYSDLVRLGGADIVFGVEPMEALRYRSYLASGGVVVTSTHPEKNIPDYPDMAEVYARLLESERLVMFDAFKVAKEAGSMRAQNMVVLGASAPYLPLGDEAFEEFIEALFRRKGEKLVKTNIDAYRFGKANGAFYTACVEAGAAPVDVVDVLRRLDSKTLDVAHAAAWAEALTSRREALFAALEAEPKGRFSADNVPA